MTVIDFPGFIDLQVNGYLGVDFSSNNLTEKSLIKICDALREKGTIGFLPTIITSSEEIYERNLPIIATAMNNPITKGSILGIHLEGPFISPEEGASGAHQEEWIKKPDTALLDHWISLSNNTIKLITIAAEAEGAHTFTQYATQKGIAVSLGHQLADSKTIEDIAHAGACAMTHLGNAIPQQINRHDNPIISGLANNQLKTMFIPDGHHLPIDLLKVILKCKKNEDLIAVSDAAPIAGLPAGHYKVLGNKAQLEENGKILNPESGYLVGSSSTLLACMQHMLSLEICSPKELVNIFHSNALKLIHIDDRTPQKNHVRLSLTEKKVEIL